MKNCEPIPSHFYLSLFKRALSRFDAACSRRPLDPEEVKVLLAGRSSRKGLSAENVARLLVLLRQQPDASLRSIVMDASIKLRKKLYGNAVAAMVPIEVSSYCMSDCRFCGWSSDDKDIVRLRLSLQGVLAQVRYLASMGFSHYEIAAGDDLDLIRNRLPAILTGVRECLNRISPQARLSICLTPLPEAYLMELSNVGLDCVLSWQETYDVDLYYQMISKGPKAFGIDNELKLNRMKQGYDERVLSHERALRSGLQIGMGVMLGLSRSPEADILALLSHAQRIVETYYSRMKPIVFGMPTWNPVARNESVEARWINPENDFPYIAALYLLSMPDRYAWVFSNCRVSKDTQLRCIQAASCFASTMVRVIPGGYMRDDQEAMYERCSKKMPVREGDKMMEGEQFEHSFATHEEFVSDLRRSGIELTSEHDFL